MILQSLKRIIIFICLIACFCLPSYAQDFWEELNTPYGVAIRSIAINDVGQIFFGAGYDGLPSGVYRSDDDGNTWDLIFDNGEILVNPIEINPVGDIFIGKRGFDPLKVSYDNGDTWDSLFYPGLGNFTAMYSPGHDTIFINSKDGTGAFLLRTYNKGNIWDTIFDTDISTEYIKDILQTQSGDMYIALTGYFPDMGGVYKSTDGGDSWEFSGLFNYMVSSLAENNEGDVFAGARGILQSGLSPGLFVLRKEENEWEELLGGHQIADVAINSDDHIYCAVESSIGVIRSVDNGQNFEIANEGLSSGIRREIIFDDYDFAYVSNNISLAKSINPTVSIKDQYLNTNSIFLIFPNPAHNYIRISHVSNSSKTKTFVKIYNSLGSIFEYTAILGSDDAITLDITNLSAGFYLIELYHDNERKTGRFIKY